MAWDVVVCGVVTWGVVGVDCAAAVLVVAPPAAVVAVVPAVGVVVAGGGAGAPGSGGNVEVPGPVTSAPFLAGMPTNAAESGVWILPSAPATLPFRLATRYPTAPGGGKTIPMPLASCSIR